MVHMDKKFSSQWVSSLVDAKRVMGQHVGSLFSEVLKGTQT